MAVWKALCLGLLVFGALVSVQALDDCMDLLRYYASDDSTFHPLLQVDASAHGTKYDDETKEMLRGICNRNAFFAWVVLNGIGAKDTKDAHELYLRKVLAQTEAPAAYFWAHGESQDKPHTFDELKTALTKDNNNMAAIVKLGFKETEHYFVIQKKTEFTRKDGKLTPHHRARLLQGWVMSFSLHEWLSDNDMGKAEIDNARYFYGRGRWIRTEDLFTDLSLVEKGGKEPNVGVGDPWGCTKTKDYPPCVAHERLFGSTPTYDKPKPNKDMGGKVEYNMYYVLRPWGDVQCQKYKSQLDTYITEWAKTSYDANVQQKKDDKKKNKKGILGGLFDKKKNF